MMTINGNHSGSAWACLAVEWDFKVGVRVHACHRVIRPVSQVNWCQTCSGWRKEASTPGLRQAGYVSTMSTGPQAHMTATGLTTGDPLS